MRLIKEAAGSGPTAAEAAALAEAAAEDALAAQADDVSTDDAPDDEGRVTGHAESRACRGRRRATCAAQGPDAGPLAKTSMLLAM